MTLALGADIVPRLQAELSPVLEPKEEATSWEGFASEHHREFLMGAGVLAGILLLSATILTFLVRHLKRRHESTADGTGLAAIPARMDPASSRRAGSRRGARAFPRPGPGGTGKPAASGDTTRLTPEGQSPSAERWKEEQVPRGLHGRELMIVLAAWGCLIAGLATMARNPDNYAACVPLLLVAFLLAVMAMAQRLVLHGSLILASLYLAAPAIWLAHRMSPKAPKESVVVRSTSPSPNPMRDGPELPTQNAPSPIPADAKPQEPPKLLIPDDDALPPPTTTAAGPVPSMTPAPVLPPLPAKAANSLFTYRAKLSRADHLNQDGVDLRTLARTKFSDILLQERLHVHQNARRDPEDTVDDAFGGRALEEYRLLLEGKPIRMPSSVSLIQLLKDDVIVDVQVFEKYVQVDPVRPLAHP